MPGKRLLAEMTPAELQKYLNLLASATECIMPDDAVFIIVVCEKGKSGQDVRDAHWVGSHGFQATPEGLRSLADSIESRAKFGPDSG